MRNWLIAIVMGTSLAVGVAVWAALPAQIDPTTPLGSDLLSQGDDQIRSFKLFLADIFGLPTGTNITDTIFDVVDPRGTLGNGKPCWEGATVDSFETCISVVDPTADRTITFPNSSITVAGIDIDNAFTTTQTVTGGVTASGTVTGGILNSTIGSNIAATNACDSGYTRVGVWCYDTDGDYTSIRSSSSNEGSYTSTVVHSGYKAAKIYVTSVNVTGAGVTDTVACTIPGDSAVTNCGTSSTQRNGASTSESKNAGAGADAVEVEVMLGATGNVKTRCVLTAGTSTGTCSWRLAAYMD